MSWTDVRNGEFLIHPG